MSAKNRRRERRQIANNQLNFSLKTIIPKTENQEKVFKYYPDNDLLLHGVPGSGKTFLAIYLAMTDIVVHNIYNKIVIVRSAQAGKEIGHLPGNEKEKLAVYEEPYIGIFAELFGRDDAYDVLKQKGIIDFKSTSFNRGITINDAVILIDEWQNLSWAELAAINSRAGKNVKIIYAGDIGQTDIKQEKDRKGHKIFYDIIRTIPTIKTIEFNAEDIVRGGFCKSWIIACLEYQKRTGVSLIDI